MKTKISTKIFLVIICSFIVLLLFSLKVNFETQKGLYLSNVRTGNRYTEISETIYNLIEDFGIDIEATYSDKKILEVIQDEQFKKRFYEIGKKYGSALYISKHIAKADQHNEIYLSSLEFPYQDNYLVLVNGDVISLEDVLNEQQRQEFLEVLKKGIYPYDFSELTYLEINYAKEGNELVYFAYTLPEEQRYLWDDGNVSHHVEIKKRDNVDNIKTENIARFGINGYREMYDKLNSAPAIFKVEEINSVVESINTFDANPGGYVSYWKHKGNMTYFITNMTFCGEQHNFNISVVDIVNDIDKYTFKYYLSENYHVYILALILAVVISKIASHTISKPIRKLEKAAQNISNNNFDEEVKINSRDEIGSLAHSVNIMRLNLMDTIDKLNEEIEKVKELESLRKDFINQFTHEMKTPLGIINGYSELLDETENEEERQRYLDIINKETVRINDLVQGMLRLSRLEAGKVELNKEVLDLEDIVTEVIDEFEVLLMKKNIKIDVNIIDKHLTGDKQQIITVLRNFISNAIKHTDSKIVVTVDKGVRVYNEGLPIDKDKLEDIWYTFVTHDKTGTGLGLAICRSILELHNYSYGVVNKDNGVEFYFNG